VILGIVTALREAIISLRIRSPRGSGREIDTVLDTGFTGYLSLPRAQVVALSLPFFFSDDITLADGSLVTVDVHEAVVEWDGQERVVPVHCLEGTPLLGMSLLWDHLLALQAVDGGSVSISPVP
jgi:clan AA aspartic protease